MVHVPEIQWASWLPSQSTSDAFDATLELETMLFGLVAFGHPTHRPWSADLPGVSRGTKDYRFELAAFGETVLHLNKNLVRASPRSHRGESFVSYLDTLRFQGGSLVSKMAGSAHEDTPGLLLTALQSGLEGLMPVIELALSSKRIPERAFYGIHQLTAREIVRSRLLELRPWRRRQGSTHTTPMVECLRTEANKAGIGELLSPAFRELAEVQLELERVLGYGGRGSTPGLSLVCFAGFHARLHHVKEVLQAAFRISSAVETGAEPRGDAVARIDALMLRRIYRVLVAGIEDAAAELEEVVRRPFTPDFALKDAAQLVTTGARACSTSLAESFELCIRVLAGFEGGVELEPSRQRCATFEARYARDLARLSYLLRGFLERLQSEDYQHPSLETLSWAQEIDRFAQLYRAMAHVAFAASPAFAEALTTGVERASRGVGNTRIAIAALSKEASAFLLHVEETRKSLSPDGAASMDESSKERIRNAVGRMLR